MGTYTTTIRLTFPGGDGQGTNTWHIRAGTPGTDQEGINGAMGALHTYYTTVATNAWNSDYSAHWDGTATSTGDNPEIVAGGTPWTATGTGSAQMGPAGVGYNVSWKTTSATRSGRGRTFHTPVNMALFDNDGSLTAAAISFLGGAASTLVTASQVDNGWAFGVYSAKQDTLRDFVSAKVNDHASWLSSRRNR